MFRIVAIIGIAVAVGAPLVHLVLFGPKRAGPGDKKRSVRRFTLWERFCHVVTVGCFLTLGITGFIAVIVQQSPLRGWLWVVHLAAAPFFVMGLLGVLVSWARDSRFASCDVEWGLKFGGYLWGKPHVPAERFNGGQKIYFWLVAALGLASLASGLGRFAPVFDVAGQAVLYEVHRYSALVFVMAAIGHLYLGTVANPGTLGAMLTGKVSRPWAEAHHSLWWQRIQRINDGNQSGE